MEEYLSSSIENLRTNNYVNLTLVIGNESCDLDSAVSSIVYAAFLHWQHQVMKCRVCTRNKRDTNTYKDDIFLPVLDVKRDDYKLKTEVVFCFREYGISENNLLFMDDIDLQGLLKDKTSIVLVDHHTLSKRHDYLAPHVTEIIDHRPIDNVNWRYKEDVRSTIETVGSCCTLVTQRINNLSTLMARNEDFFSSYKVCADLLHSVILVDTVNFSKEVDKTTPLDIEMVEFLESVLNITDFQSERSRRVDELIASRSDVSSLTAEQLLRKDLKIVGNILVPSFPILVQEYLKNDSALQSVRETLKSRDCIVALLLGMDLKNGLARDGAIISEDEERVKSLTNLLQNWTNPCLQLTIETTPNYVYFRQLNLSASRKQYIPVINDFLNKIRSE